MSATELLDILKDEVPRCTELGVHLNIAMERMETLEQQSMAKIYKDCFMEMCDYWFNNAKSRTWSVVYTALTQSQLRNRKLMLHLRDTREYKEDSTGD